MKKLFSILFCVTCALTLSAQTPDGLTCENAIPVDSSYTGRIPAPGVYYFTAWTYDLPLTCYFYPEDEVVSELYMDIDFSCTPGVYDDANIKELVDETMGWGIKMPMRFDRFVQGVDPITNKKYYSYTVEEVYRDLMANFGISYDVQAFVKVTVSSAGDISMRPDTTFRSCVETSTWLNLSDTAHVTTLGGDDVYVLPFADWQNDSVRFVWAGKQSPVQMWIGEDCGFDLKLTGENAALKCYEIHPDAGNGENVFVMNRQDIADLINFADNGGVLYMRAIAVENADLIVEKQPIQGPMADAIRLEFNQSAPVNANDVNQVYYFPTSWKVRDLLLTSENKTAMTAYFYGDVELTQPLAAYDFTTVDNQTSLGISVKELDALLKNYTDEYVFVAFNAATNTTVTPSKWDVCTCVQTSFEIAPSDSLSIKARSSSTYYRVDYNKWSKNDVTLTWKATGAMKAYLADTCTGYTLSKTNERVILYSEFSNSSSVKETSVTITGAQIRSWVDRVDESGFIYFRFNANRQGDLIVSYQPDQTIIPTSPCVANSIELKANDQLTLNLDSAFTIYRINYNEWVTTGATLTWNGTEPLHTFVAETCEFAVAPYNKYVHAYVSVPAEGAAVLDAAKLAEMASYVDEDGYLYIRFLTEKEGVLEVK